MLLWRDAWGLDQVKKGLEEGGCLRLALQGLEALNGVEGQSVQENWQSEAFASSQTLSLCFFPPLPELAKGSVHQDLCELQPLAFHRYGPETHRPCTPGTGRGQCGPRISSALSICELVGDAKPQAPLPTD